MEQQILDELRARGVPDHIAKGIVANMISESRLDPGINEVSPVVAGSRGGYGLNQWTGPRRRQYEAFAAERGVAPNDLTAQLDFTLWELQNTERGAWDALQGTDNPVDAAMVYSDRFLRPGVPHMDGRVANARRLAGLEPGPVGNALAMAPQPPQQAPQNALAPQKPNFVTVSAEPMFRMGQNQLAPLPMTMLQTGRA